MTKPRTKKTAAKKAALGDRVLTAALLEGELTKILNGAGDELRPFVVKFLEGYVGYGAKLSIVTGDANSDLGDVEAGDARAPYDFRKKRVRGIVELAIAQADDRSVARMLALQAVVGMCQREVGFAASDREAFLALAASAWDGELGK